LNDYNIWRFGPLSDDKSNRFTAMNYGVKSISGGWIYQTINQVVDHIIFVEKLQKGLSNFLNGNINSKEEAKQKPGKWLK
jgi:hypothetical protein